jgi:hypothetical protein
VLQAEVHPEGDDEALVTVREAATLAAKVEQEARLGVGYDMEAGGNAKK